jgi:hypothetical protein
MATLYWGGGTGTWDATTTTNWYSNFARTTLAGAAPTSADNVIFDSASNATVYTVTVGTNAVAQDISIAGPGTSGNVIITMNATAVINCYGSWLNAATGVAFTTTLNAVINFLATSTGKTISTNSVSLGSMGIVCNSATGGWSLTTGMLNPGSVTVTSTASAGFDTNGQTCSFGSLLSTGSVARTISLGASAITLTGTATVVNFLAATNLTFNRGTSTLTISGNSPSLRASGQTFYNVSFTSAASGTSTIQGSNTFNNLTQTSRSATGQRLISVDGDNTITGTLTLQTLGTPVAVQRTVVQSDVVGTRRTITAAALSGMADVDFRDIAAAGAASWTGTRIGNLLNNTGITFTTGVPKYWNLAAGGLWSSGAWALTTPAGAVAVANFPLAQDTAYIDLTTITTGSTINISVAWQVPTVICTRPSGSNTLIMTSGTISPQFYGNWTSCAGMSFTAPTNSWEFVGQGLTQTVTSAGIPFTQGFTLNSPGGTFRLADAFTTATTSQFSLTTGTLDLNNFVLSVGIFSGAGALARGITSGSGTFTITGSATAGNTTIVVTAGTTTNLTVDVRPTFNLTTSPAVTTGTRAISWGASANLPAVPNINVTNGSDTFTTSGTSTVNNLNLTGFTGTLGNATRNIYGNLIMNGTMTAITAGTSGTTFIGVGSQTITSAGQGLNFPIAFDGVGGTFTLQDALTVGPIGSDSTRTITLTNGTLVLNGFDLSTGQFSSSNSNLRAINFGSNKIIVTGANVQVLNMGTSTNLTFSGTPQVEATGTAGTALQLRTFIPPAVGTNLEALAVNVRVSSGLDTISFATTSSAYGNVEFTSGFTGTLSMTNSISVYGNWTFGANMVTPTTGSGTVNFASTNATTRTITFNGKAFGASNMTINGVGGTFACQDALNIGSKTLTLINGTLQLKSGTTNTVGAVATSGTNVKYLQATTPGSQATVSAPSGTDTVTYLHITDSNATGGAVWDATSTTNTNGGDNTGWLFTKPPTSGFFVFF